jgi:tetratricopeptide (TPR) repeat protein
MTNPDFGGSAVEPPVPHVRWPVRSGALPPLAGSFHPRPETGLAVAGDLTPGEIVVLTQGHEGGLHALDGAGGCGKTQLAVGLAHSLRRSGAADLEVWVTASSREAVVTSYAQALSDIGIADPAESPDAAAARFVGWLADTDRPWLVVLDDLADAPDLHGLWPRGQFGTVLATARRQPALSGQNGRTVQIGAFSRREALGYLTARLYDDPDLRVQALDLAEDLGCMPLALALAAATMTGSGLGCREYRPWFARRRQEIAGATAEDSPSTTVVTWSLALDLADQIPPAGLARPALALISMLDPNGVPGEVITSRAGCGYITGHRGTGTGTAADQGQVRDAVNNLGRLGLVAIDPACAARTVTVHALLRAAVLEYFPSAMLDQAARAAADALLETWPENEQPMMAQALRDCTARLHASAGDLLWTPDAHPVLFRAGRSLDGARLSSPAITYWKAMTETSDRILGADSTRTLTSRGSLAAAYEAAGWLDNAIGVHRQDLAERERVLGPDHSETLSARAKLAAAYHAAGRLNEAIPLYERALAGHEWVLGADHPQTLAVRGNLAEAYRAAGRPNDAIVIFQRTLADREQVLGPDHLDTLTACANLAGAYHAAGRHKDVISLLKRTLGGRRRTLGADHVDTLTTCGDLAYAYRCAGRMKEAIPLYKDTLAGRERVLGPYHLDTLTARGNLASAYHTARRLKDAIPLYQRTLAEREQVQGPDHPDTLTARGNLASAYHSAGRMADAIPLYEHTLADCERVLGSDHPDTLTSRGNLAHAYHMARRQADAIAVFQRTLADCERVLGPDHPLTRTVSENLEAATRA